jgi:CubicO group peptidase (beta-lactamase class C family)
MADTAAANTAADALDSAPALAGGHIVVFGVAVPRPELDGFLGGSGGVVSSAHDMAHWLATQNTAGTFDDRRLLSSAGTTLAHTPPSSVASTYGMGWQVQPLAIGRGASSTPAMAAPVPRCLLALVAEGERPPVGS